MSDHTELRENLRRALLLDAAAFTVTTIAAGALLNERDALAARLDRIEHAARELLAIDRWRYSLTEDDFAPLRSILEEGNPE